MALGLLYTPQGWQSPVPVSYGRLAAMDAGIAAGSHITGLESDRTAANAQANLGQILTCTDSGESYIAVSQTVNGVISYLWMPLTGLVQNAQAINGALGQLLGKYRLQVGCIQSASIPAQAGAQFIHVNLPTAWASEHVMAVTSVQPVTTWTGFQQIGGGIANGPGANPGAASLTQVEVDVLNTSTAQALYVYFLSLGR